MGDRVGPRGIASVEPVRLVKDLHVAAGGEVENRLQISVTLVARGAGYEQHAVRVVEPREYLHGELDALAGHDASGLDEEQPAVEKAQLVPQSARLARNPLRDRLLEVEHVRDDGRLQAAAQPQLGRG